LTQLLVDEMETFNDKKGLLEVLKRFNQKKAEEMSKKSIE